MKTVTEIEEATLSTGLSTTAMGMVLNATSFNHIIKSLYKNPLGAIIRELTTNALESHMLAKTNKKVAIQLPTDLDQNFIIRDFGTGLTDAEVQMYLNTLFSTSKDKDNNFMGGFGLGSKSPLALVDTFNIVSIKNGLKNNYAWITERGKLPSLVYLDDEEDRDEETSEEDGIKIVIPLGQSTKINIGTLQRTVEREARRQLLGFIDKIMIVDNIDTGCYKTLNDITKTIIKEDVAVELPHLILLNKDPDTYYNNEENAFVFIGGVTYPVPECYRSRILELKEIIRNNAANYIIGLKLPIGVLDIPMSREEVLISSHNEDAINNTLLKARQDASDYLKTLSINVDTSLVDLFQQVCKTNISKGLPFKLTSSEDSFKKHNVPLITLYSDMTKVSNPGSTSELRYRDIDSEYLSTRLLQSFIGSRQLTAYAYDNSTSRTVLQSYGYSRLYSEPLNIIVTTSPLPGGVSHNLLSNYVHEKAGNQFKTLVLQVDPVFLNRLQPIVDVFLGYQKTLQIDTSVDLGVLDVTDILAFKQRQQLANKKAANYTRATLDYIPGARIVNDIATTHFYYCNSKGSLSVRLPDTKVSALENAVGKRIPIGPEYFKTGDVILLTTNFELPINLDDFKIKLPDGTLEKHPSLFNRNSNSYKTNLKDMLILKVSSASYQGTLKRLLDAKFKVYTTDDKYVLKRPDLTSAPPTFVGNNILRKASALLMDRTGLWHTDRNKIVSLSTVGIYSKLIKEFEDLYPIYMSSCKAALAAIQTPGDLFSYTGEQDLTGYCGYDKDTETLLAKAFAEGLYNDLFSTPTQAVKDSLYLLVRSGLKEDVFTNIINNLTTTPIKGNTNEIQNQCHSTT